MRYGAFNKVRFDFRDNGGMHGESNVCSMTDRKGFKAEDWLEWSVESAS